MKKFKYLNINEKVGNVNFKLNDMHKKKVTYVYAKNGVGKTTYSRKIKEIISSQDGLVFNVDFIANNVYEPKNDTTTGHLGVKISDNTKKNAFKILIAENIKTISDEIEKLNIERSEIESLFNDGKLKPEWKTDSISWIDPPRITEILKNIDHYKPINDNTYKSEVEDKFSIIENSSSIKDIINEINAILEEIATLNNQVDLFNKIHDRIFSTEDKEVIELHQDALMYGRTFNFAGYEISMGDVEKRLAEIEDAKLPIVTKYNEISNSIKIKVKKLREKNSYRDFTKFDKYSKIVLTLNEVEEKIIDDLKTSRILKIEKLDRFKKVKQLDTKEIENEIVKFVEENKFGLLKKYDISKAKKLIEKNEEISVKNKQKNDLSIDITEKMVERMNRFICHFGRSDIELKSTVGTKKGTPGTLKIEINSDMEIQNLSEGEKKIIAISFFLAKLEDWLNTKTDEFLVLIDDPFDSNDHTKIHQFGTVPFFINNKKCHGISMACREYENKNKKTVKILIMTHNIQVIYSLISNTKVQDLQRPFNKVKYDEFIEVREWLVNRSLNSTISEQISMRSLFPNDNVILDIIKKSFKYIVENNLCEGTVRLFAYLTLRLSDGEEKNTRGKCKDITCNEIWNSPFSNGKYENSSIERIKASLSSLVDDEIVSEHIDYVESISTEIFNASKNCEEINLIKEIDIEMLIKLGFDNEEAEIFKRFLANFNNYINIAYRTKNFSVFQRLRHKDYNFSTIIAYALEEF